MYAFGPFLGPDFGSPPSFMRRKLLTVLSECGKTSSLIDDISVVKRYASELSHAMAVSSDDEALSKARKEVKLHYLKYIFTFPLFNNCHLHNSLIV